MAASMLCHSQEFGKEEKENKARLARLKVKCCTVFQSNYQYFYGKQQLGKEFKASSTKLNKAGDIVEDIGYNERGTIESWVKYGRDKNGTYTSVSTHNSSGTVITKATCKNKYDSLDRLTATLMYQDTSLIYKTNYWYDSLGRMEQSDNHRFITKFVLESYEKRFYDANGRTIRIEYYDNTGNYKSREEWKYDSNGRTAEKTAHYISVYKYAANGLITEHTDYGENDTPVAKYRYVYEFIQ